MRNLSPAQAKVVKAMQEGWTLKETLNGEWLISKDKKKEELVYHRATVKGLLKRKILNYDNSNWLYTLTDEGRKIEL